MYIPDCSNPIVQAKLPSSLCNYPPEIIAQICQRQPSLCQPYEGAEMPSIWVPIVGTVKEAVDPFGKIWTSTGKAIEAAGSATLGIGKTILALDTILPLALAVGGIYLLSQKR